MTIQRKRPALLWLIWIMPPIVHDILKVITGGGRVVNKHPLDADGMKAHHLEWQKWR